MQAVLICCGVLILLFIVFLVLLFLKFLKWAILLIIVLILVGIGLYYSGALDEYTQEIIYLAPFISAMLPAASAQNPCPGT